jgi:hypothetical protein
VRNNNIQAQIRRKKLPFHVPDIVADEGTTTGSEGCRQSRKGEQEERTVQHHRSVGRQILWRRMSLSSFAIVCGIPVGGIIKERYG